MIESNRIIKIVSKGNIFIKLISDDAGVIRELSDHFTFDVPGAKYHPLVKRKKWDGKIHLLRHDGTVYHGLLDEVKNICKKLDILVDDQVNHFPKGFDWKKASRILLRLKEHFPHDPYPHQLLAWHSIVENGNLTLISPTASGKSLILFLTLQYFENKRAILIVPTTNLVTQMKNDLISYGQDKDAIQIMMSGEDRNLYPSTKILISTWQSLATQPESFFEPFEMVLCDEVHHASAKSLIRIVETIRNADIHIGTTGSLDNIKGNVMTIQGLFGPIKQFTTTKRLMDEGKVANLKVHLIKLSYSKVDCKDLNSRMKRLLDLSKNKRNDSDIRRKMYQEEMEYLIDHGGRRAWIRGFVMNIPGNTMVLFNRVSADGERLYKEICDEYPERANDVFFVSGKTHTEDREKIRCLLEENNHAVVIASVQVFSTGVNIRNLHNAIPIAPTKSIVRVLQSIGRTLRLSDNKNEANWYDIIDDLTYGKKINYAMKHAIARVKIYRHEEFEMETKVVNIR